MPAQRSMRRVLSELSHGGHAMVDTAKRRGADYPADACALSKVAHTAPKAAASVGTTRFDYLIPDLLCEPENFLPAGPGTVKALNALGDAMGGPAPAGTPENSAIPPIYTYWGQFVDHDLTANTDRNDDISITDEPLTPLDPDFVRANLDNLRQPALNLDSVYGDGPFAPVPAGGAAVPYDGVKLRVGNVAVAPGIPGVMIPPITDVARDLPRDTDGTAQVGDGRNDENLVVAQLHVAFLRFHNSAVDWVRANEPEQSTDAEVFLRARELTRWTYQWLVVHDYLRTITAPGTVDRILTDDDDLLDLAGRGTYMPLEFSVAAFRFGHSMVRAEYDWNRNFGRPGNALAPVASFAQLFAFTGRGRFGGFGGSALPFNWIAEWDRMVDKDGLLADRFARRIDTHIAPPLADMINQIDGTEPPDLQALMKHLARRNLLRGFRLYIPTGQAMAAALGIAPLSKEQLQQRAAPDVLAALDDGDFVNHTPLWYYVLKEAEVAHAGNCLGAVGSTIVAATIIGQIRHDAGSYLQQTSWTPAHGVRLGDGRPVRSIADFLRFGGLLT